MSEEGGTAKVRNTVGPTRQRIDEIFESYREKGVRFQIEKRGRLLYAVATVGEKGWPSVSQHRVTYQSIANSLSEDTSKIQGGLTS